MILYQKLNKKENEYISQARMLAFDSDEYKFK